MNVRELMLFGMVLGVLSMVVAWASTWAKRRHQVRQQRLEVLQKALQHPALDEATRTELLRVLVREHGVAWLSWTTLRATWLGVGWTLFIVAGGMLLACLAKIVNGVDVQTVLPVALMGFAMVTLPLAWNELKFRRVAEPAAR